MNKELEEMMSKPHVVRPLNWNHTAYPDSEIYYAMAVNGEFWLRRYLERSNGKTTWGVWELKWGPRFFAHTLIPIAESASLSELKAIADTEYLESLSNVLSLIEE